MSKVIRVSVTDYDSSDEVFEKVWTFDTSDVTFDYMSNEVVDLHRNLDGWHLTVIERLRDSKGRRTSST